MEAEKQTDADALPNKAHKNVSVCNDENSFSSSPGRNWAVDNPQKLAAGPVTWTVLFKGTQLSADFLPFLPDDRKRSTLWSRKTSKM
jgi:hypothetical protein